MSHSFDAIDSIPIPEDTRVNQNLDGCWSPPLNRQGADDSYEDNPCRKSFDTHSYLVHPPAIRSEHLATFGTREYIGLIRQPEMENMKSEGYGTRSATAAEPVMNRFVRICHKLGSSAEIIAGMFLCPLITVLIESRWSAHNRSYALIRGFLATGGILFLTRGIVIFLRRSFSLHS